MRIKSWDQMTSEKKYSKLIAHSFKWESNLLKMDILKQISVHTVETLDCNSTKNDNDWRQVILKRYDFSCRQLTSIGGYPIYFLTKCLSHVHCSLWYDHRSFWGSMRQVCGIWIKKYGRPLVMETHFKISWRRFPTRF